MTWFSAMGLITAIALFLPIVIILTLRLAWYKSFPALLIYFLLVSVHIFLSLDFIKANRNIIQYYGVFNNFIDAPLMLTFMTYFSKTATFRNRMRVVIIALILFEVVIIAVFGFNRNSVVIAMAPGLSLVLAFSLIFFIHQVKIAVVYQKAAGKAFMTAALLFAYGGYSFIYVAYYLIKTPDRADIQLMYYLVTIFSSLLVATGVLIERRRVKQLNELKITREELKVIYGRS
ncbi:MAG: hypothetical protein JNN00_14790 [Chitinophagaceae bacterium]|nr:hypothetical protein [Chitinophagaceae bacterium]